MAKKALGKVEAEMRTMRENKATEGGKGSNGTSKADSILDAISALMSVEKQADLTAAMDELLKDNARIQQEAEQAKQSNNNKLALLNDFYAKATGRGGYLPASRVVNGDDSSGGRAEKGSGEKRARRGEADLKADAEAMADIIKAKSRDGGAARGDIIAAGLKMPIGLKAFVEKYTDYKIKTEGEKAQMRYFIG